MPEDQTIKVEVEHHLSPQTEQMVRELTFEVVDEITNEMEEFARMFSSQF
ncbi:MAG: hypothetical protein SV186_00850 [Candidatus Nanohaloarchaea archaeon]|nr:hypothetical protein [Candidatus Nanohaloarchaea archaeon]